MDKFWEEFGVRKEIALAIAGGGIKAFFGLGFASALRSWGIQVREVSGVSAGAAMALSTLSETEEDSSKYFQALTSRNPKNFYWNRLLRILAPFPHESIARRTVNFSVNLSKVILSGAKVKIHTVEIPKETVPKTSRGKISRNRLIAKVTNVIRAYFKDEELRKLGKTPVHVLEKMKLWGWRNKTFTEEDFKNHETTTQIVMNSCAAFPVIPLQSFDGNFYLDGGLTNNLLLEEFSSDLPKIGIYYEKTTLAGKTADILDDVLLIGPESPFIRQAFDYTSPSLVRDAFEMGKQNAEVNKSRIMHHLAPVWKKHLHSFFEQIK
ncbi:patatin-like phospholipase family protein [Leptospira perolatii]|uniref:patatin-like phospholipase family protein n=1 Tax=Leptospira perolatii TaxID=2023191 RepID=UPI001FAFF069|nr:patatin-like phospholipase family protein [Leptospira perolatii]